MTETVERFVVHHDEPMRSEIQAAPLSAPGPSEILVRVEKFGLTSNNVTYAALGKALHYFEFFPVSEKWSALPVWGIGTVVRSAAPSVSEGERIYGYFPAATHATLTVAESTPTGFRVKRALPPEFGFYDLYDASSKDPLYHADKEDLMIVMRPLFLTGVLLADYLAVSEFFGACTVIFSSAASKTAFGTATALRLDKPTKLVGLASKRSKGAAERLEVYDSVLDYADIAKLDAAEPTVFVDIAGSGPIRAALAHHLGDSLKLVLGVGLTHWKEGSFGAPEPSGVRSEMFFAPGWAARRTGELGPAFSAKMSAGWQAQMAAVERHCKVVVHTGAPALREAFAALVEGRANPNEASVFSL